MFNSLKGVTKQRGYTLVEAMVAIPIAILIIAGALVLANIAQTNAKIDKAVIAVNGTEAGITNWTFDNRAYADLGDNANAIYKNLVDSGYLDNRFVNVSNDGTTTTYSVATGFGNNVAMQQLLTDGDVTGTQISVVTNSNSTCNNMLAKYTSSSDNSVAYCDGATFFYNVGTGSTGLSCSEMFLAKQRAYTLVEVMVCVTVVSLIISLGLYYFSQSSRQTVVVQVKSDLAVIRRALDNYYHTTGCYLADSAADPPVVYGQFAGPFVTYDTSDTELINSAQAVTDIDARLTDYTDQLPLVSEFSVVVKSLANDSGEGVTDTGQPVYRLIILAKLGADFSATPELRQWYQQQLNAQQVITDGSENYYLLWQSLPANSLVQPQQQFWVLDGQQKQFRQQQTFNDQDTPNPSPTYCAN